MELAIKGVYGIDTANIQIRPQAPTYLVGMNAVGKSSIMHCAVAALLPRALPDGATKKDFAKLAVNDAYDTGRVTLTAPGIVRRVDYPDCEIKTVSGSQSPKVDLLGLQEKRLWDMSKPKRAELLADIAKAKLTEKRLDEELKDLKNLDADKRKRLVELAIGTSAETAQKVAEDWAKELKGQFTGVTNYRWGSDQGLTFKPSGWTQELEKLSLADAKKIVDDATAKYNDALIRHGEYRAAGDRNALAIEVENWTKSVNEYESRKKAGLDLIEKLKSRNGLVECNSCGIKGKVEAGKLVQQDVPEIQESVTLEEAQAHFARIEDSLGNATMALGLAKGNFDKAEGKGEPVDLDGFKKAVEDATIQFKAVDTKQKGVAIHYKIMDMLKAAEIVSPDGVAKTVLLRGLEPINKELQRLSTLAGWGTVQINNDLHLTFNGKVYHPYLLSVSERFRCDITFQVLAAIKLGWDIILIDYADTLDADGREGLLDLLNESHITSLVGITADPETFPDLKAHGLGFVYVVENQTVRELEAVPA